MTYEEILVEIDRAIVKFERLNRKTGTRIILDRRTFYTLCLRQGQSILNRDSGTVLGLDIYLASKALHRGTEEYTIIEVLE